MTFTPNTELKNDRSTEIFSVAEEMVRKKWRLSLFIYFLGTLAIILASHLFLLYEGEDEVAHEVLVEGVGDLVVTGLCLAALFYFAYVKFETKCIGWFLVFFPIITSFEIVKDIIETFSSPDLTLLGICCVLFLYLFPISLYVYFWIHCKRLYEVNCAKCL